MIEGAWVKVDQAVHGNDFWQAEYEASGITWDIIQLAEFRFRK